MENQNTPLRRPVYRSLHRPLTIAGVDRRLFFLALLVGAVAFNLFYSLLAGGLVFAAIYAFARWSTTHDRQMLHILLRAGQARRRYDAGRPARQREAG